MALAPDQLPLLVMLTAMLQWGSSVEASSQATLAGHETSSLSCIAFLVAFAGTGVLVMGGVFAHKNPPKKEGRLMSFFFGGWWKRHQRGYIRQDNTQEESVMTEVYSYYPPVFRYDIVEEESLASMSQYYENSPMLPPRPDEESLESMAVTYVPPPGVMPFRSTWSQGYWNDASSFQSSLESVDSLVESYWDPDDASEVALMPDAMEDFAVIGEHIQFLHRQARATERASRNERAFYQAMSRTTD